MKLHNNLDLFQPHMILLLTKQWLKVQEALERKRLLMNKKFIYSEKATKFCEISPLLLSYVVPVKSKVEISQNFVASSEYMNFNVQ